MKKIYEIKKPGKVSVDLNIDRIKITRKGLLNAINVGLSGDKTIKINQITSLQIKQGTNFTNGYLQFGLVGDSSLRQGLLKATQDENTVMFSKKDNNQMQELHDYIDNYKEESVNTDAPLSIADELRKYKKLLSEGIIDEDEFAALKKKTLE